MYVTDGARKQLLKDERQRFLEKEWPRIAATVERLGLDLEVLLNRARSPDDKPGDGDD
jgi:GntR family transcriptional regulator